MITGKTSSGFEFTVSENLKNDFRFVLAYDELMNGTPAAQLGASPKLVKLVLGEDGAKALYAHVQEPDGFLPTDKVMAELTEIVTASGKANGEVKN